MNQEIFKKVQETLAGALGVETSEITPESSLKRDLGAESIDFIDIIFRLEKSFDLKIPANDLFPSYIFTDERFVKEGAVTPEGIQELRTKLPYLELGDFEKDPQVAELADYFTVKMILRYLEERLGKSSGCSGACQ
ncbi:MAG: Acyl carrier protein [Candidatus Omnitrophica bacterium ADurb.Bin292]|jgi:acyl carrier protein|nr:MAG: Acyl carrier protein [Candidatus Omnitrophica bacterium ADurb.Bin292]HOG23187.1 acyl carrier protein [Candidatus Omnitrophota bacterium]HPW76713.1 acyl carrier protein [Candidatus Omnitrophota bacterium]HQB12569.1 acyl carrier protein [Candidatus Omnitrophota bacterium]